MINYIQKYAKKHNHKLINMKENTNITCGLGGCFFGAVWVRGAISKAIGAAWPTPVT